MNRIPITIDQIKTNAQEELILLQDSKILRHLKKVLRAKIGEIFNFVIIDHFLAKASLIKLSPDNYTFRIEKKETSKRNSSHLIIGLSRPLTCQKILEHGTALGIKHFHFFKAELSEKSYLDSKLFKEDRFKNYLITGLSQSGVYCDLPTVNLYPSASSLPLSTDELIKTNRFLLSLSKADNLSPPYLHDEIINKKFPDTFLIGPERGFTNLEEESFEHLGFTSITIGDSIQRVEYACSSVLAQMALIRNSHTI